MESKEDISISVCTFLFAQPSFLSFFLGRSAPESQASSQAEIGTPKTSRKINGPTLSTPRNARNAKIDMTDHAIFSSPTSTNTNQSTNGRKYTPRKLALSRTIKRQEKKIKRCKRSLIALKSTIKNAKTGFESEQEALHFVESHLSGIALSIFKCQIRRSMIKRRFTEEEKTTGLVFFFPISERVQKVAS